ncbi:MAG: amidase family protein [Synechococcaceae cyanobacterium]|nr:amidase family protein [Synechococcaceae cyanobacterium]
MRVLRRRAPALACSAAGAALLAAAAPAAGARPLTIEEARSQMAAGRLRSVDLVRRYLARIRWQGTRLAPVLAVDAAGALAEARRLDAERAAGRLRGPLHGIPVALKDVIQTRRLPTTGGALAFRGLRAPEAATLVQRLRAAGAIILAKTTLTELGNWVSDTMPNGFNALAGHSASPYDPRRDPRPGFADGRALMDPGGSSSGVGTAAGLWAASVGAETSGSIQIPSVLNSLVGNKPTVGRISRHGVIPITRDQDTPGPMARSVADAALLLGVMEGFDPHDPATAVCPVSPSGTYREALRADGLRGRRIGLPTAWFHEPLRLPGDASPSGGLDAGRRALMERAIAVLERLGAEVVRGTDLPSVVSRQAGENVLKFPACSGARDGRGNDQDCSVVLKYGMKRDFNAWLARLGPAAPVRSLTALRQFNLEHRARAIPYGQVQLDNSDAMDPLTDGRRYAADRARDLRLSRDQGLDAALRSARLDALLFPGWSAESIVNKAGYPAVVVPIGSLPVRLDPPLPAGNAPPGPEPWGMSLVAPPCSEALLIAMAYAYEQAAGGRVEPPLASRSPTDPSSSPSSGRSPQRP